LCLDTLDDGQKGPKHVVHNILNNHPYKGCNWRNIDSFSL